MEERLSKKVKKDKLLALSLISKAFTVGARLFNREEEFTLRVLSGILDSFNAYRSRLSLKYSGKKHSFGDMYAKAIGAPLLFVGACFANYVSYNKKNDKRYLFLDVASSLCSVGLTAAAHTNDEPKIKVKLKV